MFENHGESGKKVERKYPSILEKERNHSQHDLLKDSKDKDKKGNERKFN